MTGERLNVLVRPAGAIAARPRLFDALETLFPVRFVATAQSVTAGLVELVDGDPDARLSADDSLLVPRLRFRSSPTPRRTSVLLRDTPGVDRRLRRVELSVRSAPPLEVSGTYEILATSEHGVVWARRQGPTPDHAVADSLQELRKDEVLRDALYGAGGLSVIALIQFLRELCAPTDFQPPPLRATIVFDDPNLRQGTYGFIDYRQLVTHADEHNYHAVMAMIPRDARSADPATARLFAQRRDRVSVAFHGNDHIKRELLTDDRRLALRLSAQALDRIERFERATGVCVDRVMTPPHGLCSETVSDALAALGFEALSAIHPQPWSGRPPGDHLTSGWGPATFAGPLAVITRFPLTFSRTETALRAFMDGVLVFYGHHDDVAAGPDLLEEAAARANGLGELEWTSLGAIARSNYAIRREGDTIVLRPYSGRICVPVSTGATRVVVEQPGPPAGRLAGWSIDGGPVIDFGRPITCEAGRLDIRLRHQHELDRGAIRHSGPQPWAAARRAAAEFRDRRMARTHVSWTD